MRIRRLGTHVTNRRVGKTTDRGFTGVKFPNLSTSSVSSNVYNPISSLSLHSTLMRLYPSSETYTRHRDNTSFNRVSEECDLTMKSLRDGKILKDNFECKRKL